MLDPRSYPRVTSYLEALPDGLRSHPRRLTKASVYRSFLEEHSIDVAPGALPAELIQAIEDPPPATTWLPTVLVNAVELVVADTVESEAYFTNLSYQMNVRLLGSAMYRPLVFVSSPAFLLKLSAKVWRQFHRGTELHAAAGDRKGELTLTFPDGLFPALILQEKRMAFLASIEAAGARGAKVELVQSTRRSADFLATWD